MLIDLDILVVNSSLSLSAWPCSAVSYMPQAIKMCYCVLFFLFSQDMDEL